MVLPQSISALLCSGLLRYCVLKPEITEISVEGGYMAEIIMPCNVPFRARRLTGPIRSSKGLAKQAACLQMVELLHKIGQLTDELTPLKLLQDTNIPQKTRGTCSLHFFHSVSLSLNMAFREGKASGKGQGDGPQDSGVEPE